MDTMPLIYTAMTTCLSRMVDNHHWIPLLGATAIAFVVGGLWYGPLFGKVWKAEQPHRKSSDFKNSGIGMLVQALHLLAVGYVVFVIVHSMGPMMGEMMEKMPMMGATMTSEEMSAMMGNMMSETRVMSAVFGFVVLSVMTGLGMISGGIFMGHSPKFIALNVGQHLVTLAIFAVAAIL